MVLAGMLMVEYAVQGAEGARKEKVHPRNESSAPQTTVEIGGREVRSGIKGDRKS
jgi:hypothetical protein